MLVLKKIKKEYGKNKIAVNEVSFTINKGEIVGFIGHNGAGKTTTLKACVGIINFDEGDILIEGESILKNPISCKQKIAFVPDTPNLYEYLTGFQYLNFICNLYRVPTAHRKQKIKELSEKFEIYPALGDLISEYSHGMKQKIALIAALIHEPKLLILDEPFVGLDPKAFITLKELLKEFCEKGGAVLFSSHVLDVVEKLCNRLVVIRQGKIIADGLTEKLIENESLETVFISLTEAEGGSYD